MFFNKNKEKNLEQKTKDTQKNIEEKIERELIVHNMPKETNLKGEVSNPSAAGKITLDNSETQHKQSKIIGAFIMIIGVVVIGLISYFTYSLVISPVAKDDTSLNNNQPIENIIENEIIEEPVVSKEIEEIINNEEDVQITPVEEKEIEEEIIATTTEVIIMDSDKDGLSDKEELILGTNLNLSDSDKDGYNDLDETMNLYDPISSGKLTDNDNVSVYNNEVYSYQVSYPNNWKIKDSNDDLFILETLNSSFIQVNVSDNIDNLGILSWYENVFLTEAVSSNYFISNDYFEEVRGVDNLDVYITDKNKEKIYVISYIPSEIDSLSYQNIFNMIVKSFMITN